MSYKAGVVGAAGFAGIELVRLIEKHPDIELVCVTSDANAGQAVSSMYPALDGTCSLSFKTLEEAPLEQLDVVFLAVPHTASMKLSAQLVESGVTVIDLSADFRLKDPQVFEQWYSCKHTQVGLLNQAAFGLPELTGNELETAAKLHAEGQAVLVACAGCYPTATSLAGAPAIMGGCWDGCTSVVIDAISGVTGAGKKPTGRTHFCFANENLEAYGVATHRHTPEIDQILGLGGKLVFTPHLAPLNRGLLSTVNIPLSEGCSLKSTEEFTQLYADFYADARFVTVLPAGSMPRTASVVGTNNAHIGVAYHAGAHMLIAVCAIDNLGKGAAAQAVQCANRVLGLSEDAGLCLVAQPV